MTARALLTDIYAPKLGRSAWRGPYGLRQQRRHRPQRDCSGFWRGEGGALNLGIVRSDDFYRRNDFTLFVEEAARVGRLIRPGRIEVTWKRDVADPNYDALVALLTGPNRPLIPYPNFPCSTDLVGCAHAWPDHADETGRWECTLGCGTYMQVDPGDFLFLDGGTLDFGILRDRPWHWYERPRWAWRVWWKLRP